MTICCSVAAAEDQSMQVSFVSSAVEPSGADGGRFTVIPQGPAGRLLELESVMPAAGKTPLITATSRLGVGADDRPASDGIGTRRQGMV